MAHHNFATFDWPKQVTWLVQLQEVGKLIAPLDKSRRTNGFFCNLPPMAGVLGPGQFLTAFLSLPSLTLVIFSSRNMESQFPLCVCLCRWALSVSSSTERKTPSCNFQVHNVLFEGTAQLSQNPSALFPKPLEKASDCVTWVRCQPWWLGWEQGCFVQLESQELSPICGGSVLR